MNLMVVNDGHCHFFSRRFFDLLARQKGPGNDLKSVLDFLEWEDPGPPTSLADRWIQELDHHQVGRVAIMASVPGDEDSVSQAVQRYPGRLVGFFMVDPHEVHPALRVEKMVDEKGLSCPCLFPAMHRFEICSRPVLEIFDALSRREKTAVFVHCGVLSIGARSKLGLPSAFEMRYGNPTHLHHLALSFPNLPVIVPHFGAGFFREALMVADLCPNLLLDTSSSNQWIKYYSGLSLRDVFRQALSVLGPERLLFGSDSSFFPRGWQRRIWETQASILDALGVSQQDQEQIFVKNFERLFPLPETAGPPEVS